MNPRHLHRHWPTTLYVAVATIVAEVITLGLGVCGVIRL